MFGRSRVVVVCGLISACGGAAPEARAPQAPAPVAPAPPPAASRNPPPAELARYWVKSSEPQVFSARVALGTLARGPLFQAILPTIQPSVPERFRPCLAAVVAHSQELVVRGVQERGYAVVTFDAEGLAAVRQSCLGSVVPTTQPMSLPGASEAYSGGDDVLAFVEPATVLFGYKPEVEAALKPGHAAEPMPAHFTLEADALVGLRVDVPEPKVGVEGSLASSPDQFTLSARATLPGAELAERLEQGFGLFRGQAKERVKEAGGDASVVALLDGILLERSGNQLSATLALRGTIDQQAHALGQLTAMTVFATQRYIVNAKAAEAKATLAQIVKAYQLSFRESEAAKVKKPRKLTSLPPVPAIVPRGEKYQSKPEDWKQWATIRFALTDAQYFQYEVVAAKDGKSAQVIARGDLDGDGESSERKLTIELDAKTSQLTAKGFDENKPLE